MVVCSKDLVFVSSDRAKAGASCVLLFHVSGIREYFSDCFSHLKADCTERPLPSKGWASLCGKVLVNVSERLVGLCRNERCALRTGMCWASARDWKQGYATSTDAVTLSLK